MYKPNNKFYSITCVYCPTKENDKDPFWHYLHTYFTNIAHPWLLLCDFNEMLSSSDKQGGRPLSPGHLNRLPNLLVNSNGIDIPCLQKAFSWKNSQQNVTIYERLDRAIGHHTFFNDFPHSTLCYGNFIVYDHAPLLFNTKELTSPRPSQFRFQNNWTLEQESHNIVRR